MVCLYLFQLPRPGAEQTKFLSKWISFKKSNQSYWWKSICYFSSSMIMIMAINYTYIVNAKWFNFKCCAQIPNHFKMSLKKWKTKQFYFKILNLKHLPKLIQIESLCLRMRHSNDKCTAFVLERITPWKFSIISSLTSKKRILHECSKWLLLN